MALQPNQLHFVLFPFMAPGHMNPMIDIAKLLAKRGVIITILTTPVNAARFRSTLARAQESGLPIRLVELRFPCEESGLPKGCENLDLLPSDGSMGKNFLTAIGMLQEQVEILFQELMPRPSCIISDMCFPYTIQIASKIDVPRISFHGPSCFFLLCLHGMKNHYDVIESIASDSEYFFMPGLPDKIEFTKAQFRLATNQHMKELFDGIIAADIESYGVVVNSFEELEPEYAKGYQNAIGGKVWCIGPVSLCNEDKLDKAQRSNDASTAEHECLYWLDTQEPQSVVYVCLGSLCNLPISQLIELGLGLEASKKPFLWVIRRNEKSKEIQKWIVESGFEERIKEREAGFLFHGFAPQLLILSHPAIGGFITHCGWNSVLEGLAAGIPLITWPLFANHFCNEKLVVQVLKVGVRVGAECAMQFGEEEKFWVVVNKEDVMKAIDKLMEEGEEGQARRERAKEIGKMAKRAVEEGGSSHLHITMLIEDIMQQAKRKL